MGNGIVNDIMTQNPKSLPASASVFAAAQEMERSGFGAVTVEKNGKLCGIVTDRDIVVRCVARGDDCRKTQLASICSPDLATLSPSDTIDNAIALMRKKAIRRIPVVEDGKTVGIVSLGDLALARDPKSALGGISAAPPNP